MKTDILELSIHYAKTFSDPAEIPARYRGSKRKTKDDTKILKDFEQKIKNWELTLMNICRHFGNKEADRLIKISPVCEPDLTTVADASDFNIINDYMILKRDVEICGDGELGCLALLSVAIQNKIEIDAGLPTSKTPTIQNRADQKIHEQRILTL